MLDNRQDNLAYLTTDLPGIGGLIKIRPEDFFVEEIPLYSCSGEGTHLYIQIEKRKITTLDVLRIIASALNMPRKEIGYAGLKDARAVARQWISIEHIKPQELGQLDLENIKFLQFKRHGNKLRIGHLAGNRFVIRLRQVQPAPQEAMQRAERIMAVLAQRGAPNYFGPQRFGTRQDGHLLGKAF